MPEYPGRRWSFVVCWWRWNVSGAEHHGTGWRACVKLSTKFYLDQRVCKLYHSGVRSQRFSLFTLWMFLFLLIKFDINPGKQQLTSGRTHSFIIKQPNKNGTKEAQSVWTFCLFKCPAFLLTLNSSLKIRVIVMCVRVVTARSAVCLLSWRRRPGPCWHHWYTPTDRPSTPSTASPAEEPHTDEEKCECSSSQQTSDISWKHVHQQRSSENLREQEKYSGIKEHKNNHLYLVVSSGNGQYVSSDGPADVPNNIVELMQQFGRPGVSCRVVARPDEHASVLQEEKRGMWQSRQGLVLFINGFW